MSEDKILKKRNSDNIKDLGDNLADWIKYKNDKSKERCGEKTDK